MNCGGHCKGYDRLKHENYLKDNIRTKIFESMADYFSNNVLKIRSFKNDFSIDLSKYNKEDEDEKFYPLVFIVDSIIEPT